MRSRRSIPPVILMLALSSCVAPPVEPQPTPTAERVVIAPTVTHTPTITSTTTQTPAPTTTHTPTVAPSPTLPPTATATPTPVIASAITITDPLPGEFVGSAMTVSGAVVGVNSGVVWIGLATQDGQPLGPDPIQATTQPMTDGLAFTGEISIELPPTPRQIAVQARWSPTPDAEPAVGALQPINLLGRYPRIVRIMVESPVPLERGADPQIPIRGYAPGPPARVVARLLDEAGNVLESTDAAFAWREDGKPVVFTASLPNNLAATRLQILSLGADDTVLESATVRLEMRR